MTETSVHVLKIFDQAQVSVSNHQKNFVALHKLHVKAAQHTEGLKLVGERVFEKTFLHMLTRVLPLKKGIAPADRIIKFIGGYTRFINEKAVAEKGETEPEDEEDGDTTASRFTARVLKFLLKGFQAKAKYVRYRVLQTIAEMVSYLGEVDVNIYTELRAALLDRVHDKEASVRAQALIALSKLSGSEAPSEVAEGENTVVDVIIDTLAHDSSSEVRRAILLNIPINQTTLPHIHDRTRDIDVTIRKLVYSAVLEPNTTQPESTAMGATNPLALTIAQRESIVRHGLGDRDSVVKSAAGSLMGTWIDVVGDLAVAKTKTEGGDAKVKDVVQPGTEKIESAVVALLHMFDLREGTVAADALLSVFETRVDIFDNIEFGEKYWTNLTPETALLARVFVDHCKATNDDVRLEAALPVVTDLAFRIQESYHTLIDDIQGEEEEKIVHDVIDVDADDERVRREDSRIDKEFMIGEMLALAVNLDYADEIGRRKMFQLLRDMLVQELLPQSLPEKCLDVLRQMSTNERDFIRIVVEIVWHLRDLGSNDKDEPAEDEDADTSFGDTLATVRPARVPMFQKQVAVMSPEEKRHADEIDLRCLSLCIGMLKRVNGTYEENSALAGILEDLVTPALRRKDIAFREKGLIGLGMCCLITRHLALINMEHLINQVPHSPEGLKIHLLEVIFDILMVHENDFLAKDSSNVQRITRFLKGLLRNESSDKVLALLCVGISKLIYSGMITGSHVIKRLIIVYLSPHTAKNQQLRQCLAYFLPRYCYFSPVNQQFIEKIFIKVYKKLNKVRRDMEEDEEMSSAAQVGAQFVEWTNPLNLIKAKAGDGKGPVVNDSIHLRMARRTVKALIDKHNELEEDEKKALCQLLVNLYIPDTVDDYQLRKLKIYMNNLRTRRPLHDASSIKNFDKFEATICKKFEKQLENFSEEEYRKLEELKNLFEFVDSIIPEDDDEVVDVDAPKKKAQKRGSECIVSTSTEADDPGTPSLRCGKLKSKPKRRRVSKASDDESDGIEEISPPPRSSTASPRALFKRGVAKKHVVIEISSDSDENSIPMPPKARQRQSSSASYQRIKEEAEIDADIDDLLDEGISEEIPYDSIMDNSEDEEDEVNDLLADD